MLPLPRDRSFLRLWREAFRSFLLATVCIFALSHSALAQAPPILWVAQAGGPKDDGGRGIAVDPDGNVIVAGEFRGSIQFNGTHFDNPSGQGGMFVVKYDAFGKLLWVRVGTGTNSVRTTGVAVDSTGAVVVTGGFRGRIDFDGIVLNHPIVSDESIAMFLVKYSREGEVLWARKADWAGGASLAVDDYGNVFVAGGFRNTANFEGTELVGVGQIDLFLAKYDPLGNLLWVRHAGEPGEDVASGVATDAYGNAIITGWFDNAINFDGTTLGSWEWTHALVVKYSSDGSLLWAEDIVAIPHPGAVGVAGYEVATDPLGNILVTGEFRAEADFSGTRVSSIGKQDAFVAKYGPEGNLLWVRHAGGTDSLATGHGITTDSVGNAFISGRFSSQLGFPDTPISLSGWEDAFIAKYDPDGNLLWAKGVGGREALDVAFSVDVDGEDHAAITGLFEVETSFDGIPLISRGQADVFVAKLGAFSRGDANADGKINVIDARICLQFSEGWLTLSEERQRACDVNEDSKVTQEDAVKVAEFSIGLLADLSAVGGPAGVGFLMAFSGFLLRRGLPKRKWAVLGLMIVLFGLTSCGGPTILPSGSAGLIATIRGNTIEISVRGMPGGGLAALGVKAGGFTFDPRVIRVVDLLPATGWTLLASYVDNAQGEVRFALVHPTSGVESGRILTMRILKEKLGGPGVRWDKTQLTLGDRNNQEIPKDQVQTVP